MPELEVGPVQAIVDRVVGKVLVGTKLKTKDIQKIPVDIRDRGLFSAGVDNLRTVQSISDKLGEWSDSLAADPDRALMNKGKFISELRQELGAVPGDTGDITDLTSERRLGLIYDFQTTDAAGYADWKTGMDPDILDAFPAQELIRLEAREVPRGFRKTKDGLVEVPEESWPARWEAAGGTLIDGRMIALKTDPIWSAISAFGRPWPPFDFQSGMGLQDIARDEAESLGLLKQDEEVKPLKEPFNTNLSASATDLDKEFTGLIKEWFGDKVKVSGDEIRWND